MLKSPIHVVSQVEAFIAEQLAIDSKHDASIEALKQHEPRQLLVTMEMVQSLMNESYTTKASECEEISMTENPSEQPEPTSSKKRKLADTGIEETIS